MATAETSPRFRLPTARSQPIIVLAALAVLWAVIPRLLPVEPSQPIPVRLIAASPEAGGWLTIALIITAAALVALGWYRPSAAYSRMRVVFTRLLVLMALFVAWAVLPAFLGGNPNREPYILVRGANEASLLWFVISLASTGLSCVLAGQLLQPYVAARRRDRRVLQLVSQNADSGIALFDRRLEPEWVNEAARAALLRDGRLTDDAARLLKRARDSGRVASQSMTLSEHTRVNVQASPLPTGGLNVIARPLSSDADQNQFYERFIRRIVHDMRNPLAAIIAHASNLHTAPPEDVRTWQNVAQTIENEAQRLTRLVDSMLFDARLSYVPLALDKIDLVDVIEDVVFQHDERAIREEKTIEVETPPQPAPIEADRDLLVRALSNVVDNSLKYSKPGATVRVVLETLPGKYRLKVIDTGDGIPLDYLPTRIFEPLIRARKDGISGSGLGLSIVKKIIEMHQGTISAESTVGKGTTMTIMLGRSG